jgi:hypothetical protein
MGPTVVVIKTTSEIREQRLEKKIRRLTQQRDHWKNEFEDLNRILRFYPNLKQEYGKYRETQAKLARAQEMSITQALLINENERLKAKIEALEKVAEMHSRPSL